MYTLDAKVISTAIMENNMEVPQKIKIEPLYALAIPLLGIYMKITRIPTWTKICNPKFNAALFTTATDRWMDEKNVIHIYRYTCTEEYYSAFKNN